MRVTMAMVVERVARRAKVSKHAAKVALDTILEMIQKEANAGHRVVFAGFGVFSLVDRAPRRGRHPVTGAPVEVPARRVLVFRPSRNASRT
mgnify:FL=1